MKTETKASTLKMLVLAAHQGATEAVVTDYGIYQRIFRRCQYPNATAWALAVMECAKRSPQGHHSECASNRMAEEGKPCNEEDQGRGICDCYYPMPWADRIRWN
jgi:hypothetical protein